MPFLGAQHYADDIVLPRMEDGNGFGAGKKPPADLCANGSRCKRCELFAAGFRNTYDIDFSPDGELFGFDSDMEWDWARPGIDRRGSITRSGGDYGSARAQPSGRTDIRTASRPRSTSHRFAHGREVRIHAHFPDAYEPRSSSWTVVRSNLAFI